MQSTGRLSCPGFGSVRGGGAGGPAAGAGRHTTHTRWPHLGARGRWSQREGVSGLEACRRHSGRSSKRSGGVQGLRWEMRVEPQKPKQACGAVDVQAG